MLVKLLEDAIIHPRGQRGVGGAPHTMMGPFSLVECTQFLKSEEIRCKKENQSHSRELINSRELEVVKE